VVKRKLAKGHKESEVENNSNQNKSGETRYNEERSEGIAEGSATLQFKQGGSACPYASRCYRPSFHPRW
jgi:hypothetical protein